MKKLIFTSIFLCFFILKSVGQCSPYSVDLSATNLSCVSAKDGSINITSINGGTSPYSYYWQGSNGFFSNDENINTLEAGSYTLTVIDNNECQSLPSFVQITEPFFSIQTTSNDVNCFGGNDGSSEVIVTGGVSPFEFDWFNIESDQSSISALEKGEFSVIVTDANNCKRYDTIQINEPPSININLISTTAATCYGGDNGEIKITVSGGTGTYSYLWVGPSYTNSNNINTVSGLEAGGYSIKITDQNNCQSLKNISVGQSDEFEVDEIQISDISCNGSNNGEIQIDVTGGVGSYTYIWTLDDEDYPDSSEDITNLSAGEYKLKIIDENNCDKEKTYEIKEPDALTIELITQDISCHGANDGFISINANGGTGDYSFNWTNDSTSQSISMLAEGLYNIELKDEKNCTVTDSYFISEPEPLFLVITDSTSPTCYDQNNGFISSSVSGGIEPYLFEWSDITLNTNQRDNLSGGNYILTVKDDNECLVYDSSIVLTAPSQIEFYVSISDHLCFEDNSASISIDSIVGGTGDYYIQWSNLSNSTELYNLELNSISLIVSDENICNKSEDFEFEEVDSIKITLDINNITCVGAENGSILANIEGGTGPYEILWSNGETTPQIDSLEDGSYTIQVTDANDCTNSKTITLESPNEINLTVQKEDVSCNGFDNGSATAYISGNLVNTNNYSIYWSNGTTNNSVNNLSSGNYFISVQNSNNCTQSIEFYINEPEVLTVSFESNDISCYGLNDGSITANVNGGNGEYTYQWLNNETTATIDNLSDGLYSISVEDEKFCSVVGFEIIEEPEELSLSANFTNVSCNGLNDGSIDLTIQGGTLPYEFLWNNNQTTEDLNNLIAGYYTVQISDAENCEISFSDLITEPNSPVNITANVSDISCSNGSNGSIDIEVSGGTAPYNYIWSNGQNSEDLIGLTTGLYSLLLIDNNNCIFNYSTTLASSTPIVISDSIVDESCYGSSSGEIFLDVNGGTPPYSYSWNTGESTKDISSLSNGEFTVEIQDSLNCIKTQTFSVSSEEIFNVFYEIQNTKCFGDFTGNIQLSISGGFPPFSFEWSDGNTDKNRFGLGANEYSVTIIDSLNCQITENYTVFQPDAISLDVEIVEASCATTNDGSITTLASGGTPPYYFTWSNSEITPSLDNTSKGNYSVEIIDNNDCEFTNTYFVGEIGECLNIPTVFTPNGDGVNDKWVIRNIENYSSVFIQVINDIGIPIYTSENYDSWNAEIDGKKIKDGVYFYIIVLDGETKYSGPLTIIR